MNLNFSWVEIDPELIIESVIECIEKVCEYLIQMGLSHTNIKGISFFVSFSFCLILNHFYFSCRTYESKRNYYFMG